MEHIAPILARVLKRLDEPHPRCPCGGYTEEQEERTPGGTFVRFWRCVWCGKRVPNG